MCATIFGAAWLISEIQLRMEPNHHSQVMLVQIPNTHGTNFSFTDTFDDEFITKLVQNVIK